MTREIDDLVARQAAIEDHRLSASGTGARALLGEILAEDTPMAAGSVGAGARSVGAGARPIGTVAGSHRSHRRPLVLALATGATVVVATALISVNALLPAATDDGHANALNLRPAGSGYVASVPRDYRHHDAVDRLKQRYRRMGLDVRLKEVPVSADRVGGVAQVRFTGAPGTHPTIDAPPLCESVPQPPDAQCRMPMDLWATQDGAYAEIWVGRATRPGETYAVTWPATDPGQPLAGMAVAGRHVADVIRDVKARGFAVDYAVVHLYGEDRTWGDPVFVPELRPDRPVFQVRMHSPTIVTVIVEGRAGDPGR